MATKQNSALVVAISSRALFDLEKGHAIYTEQGIEAYHQHQLEHENEALAKGVAFPLVQKLLDLNAHTGSDMPIEVVLISRNSADTGLRIFNAIEQHELGITRAAFTGGEPPWRYAQSFNASLFLSADPTDVRAALEAGIAAATLFPTSENQALHHPKQLKIAFDGDAVLFSDAAEQIYQSGGLAQFTEHEKQSANDPLPGGPFKQVLARLHQLQSLLPSDQNLIRTALFTARAAPAHERVIKTLRAWNIRIDEAVFLGGIDKGEFLRNFEADIFFDDQKMHCASTGKHVPAGHVPHGVANQEES